MQNKHYKSLLISRCNQEFDPTSSVHYHLLLTAIAVHIQEVCRHLYTFTHLFFGIELAFPFAKSFTPYGQ